MARANHISGLFAKLAQIDMRCPAYRALSPWARCAVLELDLYYWETGRLNPVTLTQRWLAGYLNVNAKTAAKVLDELEGHWFLEPTRLGRTTGPNGLRGAEYQMSWLPTSDGLPPTFGHRNWLPAIPRYEGKIGASTRRNAVGRGPRTGNERADFRSAGASTQELLERLKAKQTCGKATTPAGRREPA